MPEQDRIALFIDGANLYATAKSLGFDIDYKRLLRNFPDQRQAHSRFLLHGACRGSGIFLDPAADRLARLQRLRRRDEADEGIRRLDGPPQGQRQYGYRACRSMPWRWPSISMTSSCSPAMAIFARSWKHCSARACASRRVDDHDTAADGGRRVAPAGGRVHRSRPSDCQDRPRSRRARRAHAALSGTRAATPACARSGPD